MTSAVLTVTVTVAGMGQRLTTHESPGHDRSAQRHSDKLTTSPTPPTPTPNHVNDQLTTTTTINHVNHQPTTTDNTTTNHHQNRSRHWHPAVPFPGAAVTGAAEVVRAAPC